LWVFDDDGSVVQDINLQNNILTLRHADDVENILDLDMNDQGIQID